MKAMVFRAPYHIQLEEVPEPQLQDDRDVIVKVEKASICGSDLHIYRGESIGLVDYGQFKEPFIVGHEFIGKVVEKGSAITAFNLGDQVLVSAAVGCGQCRNCANGDIVNCETGKSDGYGLRPRLNGGQAEFVRIPYADINMALIPPSMSDKTALLLTDQLPTAYFAAKNAGIQYGEDAAVIGLGPIGLLAVECAFFLGASRVFATDPVPERQEMAKNIGAEILTGDRPQREIRERNNGKGADCVIETAGLPETIHLAIKMARINGKVSVISIPGDLAQIPVKVSVFKNLTIKMGLTSVQKEWQELLPLAKAGRIDGSYVFTHEFSLSEGEAAYRLFNDRKDGCVKTIINN